MPTSPKPELADVLAHLSNQLILADEAAKQRGKAAMQFEECEVEFAIKVDTGAKAGIKVWVIEIGADAKYEQSNRIKIKFKTIPGSGLQAAQGPLNQPAEEIHRQ